ncbi:hypothetical protein [Bradyrhizobium sp. 33ap4]|uniref:hypothetical protein n=1 Tax=Bradyrhizobium sp. 33ap4 TaxID=3061630 RepID=UPI00293113D0|nr:hypothetical protein [Bradyrhizobium sp. 33ap4]
MQQPRPSLDDLRRAQPDLAFAVYAMEPRGIVTLEIYTDDGQVYSFTGETEADAILAAFPAPPEEQPEPAPALRSIFD